MKLNEKRKSITAAQVKIFLDSFCQEGERDFTVTFSKQDSRCASKYFYRKKRIVLYPKACKDFSQLRWECVALYELAQHLACKRHQENRTQDPFRYWSDFNAIMSVLMSMFVLRYHEYLNAREVFDSKKATLETAYELFLNHYVAPDERDAARKMLEESCKNVWDSADGSEAGGYLH